MGQGRGPDAEDIIAGFGADVSDMKGVWLDFDDGGRGLVVATGIILASRLEQLLVEMRGGGPRRVVPWCGGQPRARIVLGERKELVVVAPVVVAIGVKPKGTHRHRRTVDAMVRAESTQLCIRQVPFSDTSPAVMQRAYQLA